MTLVIASFRGSLYNFIFNCLNFSRKIGNIKYFSSQDFKLILNYFHSFIFLLFVFWWFQVIDFLFCDLVFFLWLFCSTCDAWHSWLSWHFSKQTSSAFPSPLIPPVTPGHWPMVAKKKYIYIVRLRKKLLKKKQSSWLEEEEADACSRRRRNSCFCGRNSFESGTK